MLYMYEMWSLFHQSLKNVTLTTSIVSIVSIYIINLDFWRREILTSRQERKGLGFQVQITFGGLVRAAKTLRRWGTFCWDFQIRKKPKNWPVVISGNNGRCVVPIDELRLKSGDVVRISQRENERFWRIFVLEAYGWKVNKKNKVCKQMSVGLQIMHLSSPEWTVYISLEMIENSASQQTEINYSIIISTQRWGGEGGAQREWIPFVRISCWSGGLNRPKIFGR